jgi:hypothetical protein
MPAARAGGPNRTGADHDNVMAATIFRRNQLKHGAPSPTRHPLRNQHGPVTWLRFAIVAIIARSLVRALVWPSGRREAAAVAFLGWLFYLVLKLFAPETASKVKETITGKPA